MTVQLSFAFFRAISLFLVGKKKIYVLGLLLLLLLNSLSVLFRSETCHLALPDKVSRAFRPLQSCDFCKNVKQVDEVEDISPAKFEDLYAYSGAPVVVKGATQNWTASKVFSFEYFREVYLGSGRPRSNCQFFPYKTEFRSLEEALSMDSRRAKYISGKPWYFGWSNCDNRVGRELRRHYHRPSFLPENSEGNSVDWIFMGGSGFGAHMHVDNVRLPSWQAQILGTKEWTLAPPPECLYQCRWFNVTVRPGDVFVLDTNKWFHKTRVLPGDLSITIGAEYD